MENDRKFDRKVQTFTSMDAETSTCTKFFNAVYYCITPMNQVTSMYRTGDLDTCVRPYNRFKKCLSVKFTKMKDPDAGKVSEQELYQIPRPSSLVWDLRDKPMVLNPDAKNQPDEDPYR
jgi:hypothetical protein